MPLTWNGAPVDALTLAPETHYAKAADIHVAYQVFGDGPVDMVLATEFWHSIEVQWDQPELAAFLERLSSFAREWRLFAVVSPSS